jgi:hypothetical protein
VPAIGGFNRPELIERAIVELKLQLFVEAVPEVSADKFMYGLVVARIHLRSSPLGSIAPKLSP